MEEPQQDWHYFIEGLRGHDEAATLEFCKRYGAALERLAARHLVTGMRRRLDPEDVVQSVYRTFFRRASDGQFSFSDRTDLWRLLCVITLTKVREQARSQLRSKRNINREVSLDGNGKSGSDGGSRDVPSREPLPETSLEFTEQFEKVMASFDEEERQIVELKLQGLTNDRVAHEAGCSERTVRRILKRVQEGLERLLDDDGN